MDSATQTPRVDPPGSPGIGRKTIEIVRSLYERQSMVLVRHLYERMRRRTLIYRALAVLALLVALGFGVRVILVNRRIVVVNNRIDAIRSQAAEVFYRLKTLELQVARLQPDSAERQLDDAQRARLASAYAEWSTQLEKASTDPPEVRAIREAVSRLGEAPMLVSSGFIRDVRARIAHWRRTGEFTTTVRAAVAQGYPAMVESVLVANSLPRDLVWLAFQETHFSPTAVGPPTRFGFAKGMWQLLPSTAREYGLRVGPLVGQPRYDPRDQRFDVTLATRAAVRYVGDLYLVDAQGSGLLVMASYNAGQTLVRRLLRSLPPTPKDRNFWQVLAHHRDDIPDETYGYVVGIVAAAAAAATPQAFGLRSP